MKDDNGLAAAEGYGETDMPEMQTRFCLGGSGGKAVSDMRSEHQAFEKQTTIDFAV